MLIKCKECGKENISSEAKVCPSCGYPMQSVTIEKTGKKFKKIQVYCSVVLVIGIIVLSSSFIEYLNADHTNWITIILGAVLSVGAIAILIYTSAKVWWHHG